MERNYVTVTLCIGAREHQIAELIWSGGAKPIHPNYTEHCGLLVGYCCRLMSVAMPASTCECATARSDRSSSRIGHDRARHSVWPHICPPLPLYICVSTSHSARDRSFRTGFCSPDLADFHDLYISSDEKLFNKILTRPNRILRTLLPPPRGAYCTKLES